MKATLELPLPHLSKGRFASVSALTDDDLYACLGVRIAFTDRMGGVSAGPFESLNLGAHVNDDVTCVERNRAIVAEAFRVAPERMIVPLQVHGTHIVVADGEKAADVERARTAANAGADALVVEATNVAALLCFADCVPVIIVSPSGRFAVAHAGWRGAVHGIAAKTASLLARLDERDGFGSTAALMNAYLGPHICAECFETGDEVRARFLEKFGEACTPDERHVDLACALRTDLKRVGVVRVADAGQCTVCGNERYFSHRAQNGVAGRHGAFAYRQR
ncbi:polyphenol oxidase family protein [Raoultibacter phocaeensis]|uniref:polyphenol oxidase family protein n=1 Tax=Raoultibacter phocaeensis TaxID=2479841 RepID=UPI001119DC56|nr:polyphenol oxidase family protein [Raoultibacter phocaeensis]